MQNIYTIRDEAAKYFFPIFLANTDAEAIRMFSLSLGEKWPHRVDYILFRNGTFDSETGLTTSEETPVLVMPGINLEKQKEL